jgi:FHA domain
VGKLVLYLADGSTLDILLNRERVTIGRRADNDVCLPYPAVSAEHASVVTILADSFLEDLGSTNGTLVNGRPVAKHFLRDRDQIDIGRQKLVFVADDALQLEPAYVSQAIAHKSLFGERVEQVSARPADVREPVEAAAAQNPGAMAGRETDAMGEIDRFVSAEVAADARAVAADSAPARGDIVAEFVAGGDLAQVPSVRVLSGVNSGRTIVLNKDAMSLGRAGVQVAVIRRSPHGARLVPLEGDRAPIVNDSEVPAEGTELRNGDVVEIAGVKLEFVAARTRS